MDASTQTDFVVPKLRRQNAIVVPTPPQAKFKRPANLEPLKIPELNITVQPGQTSGSASVADDDDTKSVIFKQIVNVNYMCDKCGSKK